MQKKLKVLLGVLSVVFICLFFQNTDGVFAKMIKQSGSDLYLIDLKVDQNNKPHILFINSKAKKTYYAIKDKKWKIEQVPMSESNDNIVICETLALDKLGSPHILYSNSGITNDLSKLALFMVEKGNDSWHESVIAENYGSGSCDLKIDSKDRQHIVADNEKGELKYFFRRNDKIVSTSLIESKKNYGYLESLELWKNKPYVVYTTINTKNFHTALMYSYLSGKKWKKNTIKNVKDGLLWIPTLYFDNAGYPYISVDSMGVDMDISTNNKVNIGIDIDISDFYSANIFWSNNKAGSSWNIKRLISNFSLARTYSGYFDSKNRFHFFIAPNDGQNSDFRNGYLEFIKFGQEWTQKLCNEQQKISLSSKFAVSKDKVGNIQMAYVIKENKKYKIIYKK